MKTLTTYTPYAGLLFKGIARREAFKKAAGGHRKAAHRCILGLLLGFGVLSARAQTSGEAALKRWVPQAAVRDEAGLLALPADSVAAFESYTDAAGRPLREIARRQSVTRKDLVQFYEYDEYGRQARQYLPYTTYIDSLLAYQDKHSPLEEDGSPVNMWNPAEMSAAEKQEQFYNLNYTMHISTGPKAWMGYDAHLEVPGIAHTYYAYGTTSFEELPQSRVSAQSQPGMAGQHPAQYRYALNEANEVKRWGPSQVKLARLADRGYYAANTLRMVESRDGNGNRRRVYTDLAGRTVLSRAQIDVNGNWLDTYYLYNEQGQLWLVLPPEAVNRLHLKATPSQAFLDTWAFQYTYDDEGRLLEKQTPGAGAVWYVYDPAGRVALAQDAAQRSQHKWHFIKYDEGGRPVLTGETALSRFADLEKVQSWLDSAYAQGEPFYETEGSDAYGYSNQALPDCSDPATQVLAVSYYDHYDFNRDGKQDAEPVLEDDFKNITVSTRNRGQLTGSRVRVLGTEDWIQTAAFYDDEGRPVQAQRLYPGGESEQGTALYAFNGALLQSEQRYTGADGIGLVRRERLEYDQAGRLRRRYRQVNGQAEVLAGQYTYNELGQVISQAVQGRQTKTQTATGKAPKFLQEVNYAYNVPGSLVAINGSGLGDEKDLFGLALHYHADTLGALGGRAQYNGNLTGLSWQSRRDSVQRTYAYQYDAVGRLTAGRSGRLSAGGQVTEADRYSLTSLAYDNNGNITALSRQGLVTPAAGQTPAVYGGTDQLAYTYAGNQLVGVDDGAAYASGTGRGDFADNGSSYAATQQAEYTYDANGSLTADANKQLSLITYNALQKTDSVAFASGTAIKFSYDGSGTLLGRTVYDNTGAVVNRLRYRGSITIENDTVWTAADGDGRLVRGRDGYWRAQYHYTDHLGNVRMTYGEAETKQDSVVLTMELAANEEGPAWPKFRNVNSTRGGNAHSGTRSARVTNANGPATRLQVKEGERVALAAWYYFPNPAEELPGGGGEQMAQSFGGGRLAKPVVALGALALPAAAITNEGRQAVRPAVGLQLSVTGLLSAAFAPKQVAKPIVKPGQSAGGIMARTGYDNPRAHLVWELYADSAGTKLRGSGSADATKPGSWQQLQLSAEVQLDSGETEGWLEVKLVNDNDEWIWFDDLSISRYQRDSAEIIQEDQYDPLGQIISDLSYRKPDQTENRNLYNAGSEWQKDLQWYGTFYRQYDPQLGRFHQSDPAADLYHSLTPYQYAGNNALRFNDPLGDKFYDKQMKTARDMDEGTGFGSRIVMGNPFSNGTISRGYTGPAYTGSNSGLSNPGFDDETWAMVTTAWNGTPEGSDYYWANTNNTAEGMAYSPMSGGASYDGYYYYTTGKYYGANGQSVTVNGVEGEFTGHSVAMGSQQNTSGNWLDNMQTALDVGGIADPTGIADGINALIYVGRGQWGNAAISAMSIIPYIGDVGKAGRLGAKTLQLTGKARTAEASLELATKFLGPGYKEIASGVFRSADDLRGFRMTTSDLMGKAFNGIPHVHFEKFIPGNLNSPFVNWHIPLK